MNVLPDEKSLAAQKFLGIKDIIPAEVTRF